MKNTLTIARREIQAYFVSPIAYVVAAAFLAIMGYFFAMILYYSREATMRYTLGNMTTVLLFVAPILTMRLLAEEQRMGTIELLLTAPVKDWEVVLGKFLGSLALYACMLGVSLYFPLVLTMVGNPDPGPIVSGYVGMLLLGGALLSLGVLTSSLTQNQIVSAVLGVVLIILLWLVSALGDVTGAPLSGVFRYLALSEHFYDFFKGVIDTRDVIYYLSVIAAALFLATRVLETRRWR
ncbi:MAG: ABC transporter permease [Anaerolineae bacterium]